MSRTSATIDVKFSEYLDELTLVEFHIEAIQLDLLKLNVYVCIY